MVTMKMINDNSETYLNNEESSKIKFPLKKGG